jgi:hypothetical protein
MWSLYSNRRWKYASYVTLILVTTILSSSNAFVPSSATRQNAVRIWPLAMSSHEEDLREQTNPSELNESPFRSFLHEIGWRNKKRPPVQVDDTYLLFYDIFLILNLCASISFWVVHRMDFNYIGSAFSEGCLMSILWIGAGLYTGAFLYSAVDGHYNPGDERGGPKAAGLLGFQTFLNAVNLRLVFALVSALLQHRPVGSGLGEDLLPLEIGFGLVLMGCWRLSHSSFVPRL